MSSNSNQLIKNWYYFPALVWFFISVIIGVWMRLEWHNPIQHYFDIRNLIHAHSHAALLGWMYIVFAGFTLKHFIHLTTVISVAKPMALTLHLSNVGMLIAFSLQGYAFWSILFSTIHLIATVWLAFLLLLRKDKRISEIAMKFAGAAWLWLILSGFGPFALAFTGGMASVWAQFWLGSYLYLLTNGWILFMMISILLHHLVKEENHPQLNFGFNLMYYTLPGSMLSMFYVLNFPIWVYWIGWFFNLAFALGSILVLVSLFKSTLKYEGSKFLLYSGLIFLGLKTALQLIAFWPSLIELTSNHLLKVSFLHLFLLGCISLLIISLFYSDKHQNSKTISFSHLLIGLGTISMIVLLFMMAGLPLIGYFIFLPYQFLFALTGGLIVAGSLLILRSNFQLK